MPVSDVVRILIRDFNDDAERPLAGAHLLARHLDVGLTLSWSFPFLALALHYFTRLSPRLAFGAFALVWAACLLPQVTGDTILEVYRMVAISTMLAVWACLGRALWQRDIEPVLAHL